MLPRRIPRQHRSRGMSTLTPSDLPIPLTFRFGYSREACIGGKLLRVLDDSAVEVKMNGIAELQRVEWSSTLGGYVIWGRTLYVSHNHSPLDDKPVPRITAPKPDNIEGFLEWCATQNIFLGRYDKDRAGARAFYRINELTTGTEADLIARFKVGQG